MLCAVNFKTMKQKQIRVEKEKVWEDITYTVGYYEGHPITETMSVQEQKDIISAGLTVDEIIDNNIQCYGDWQRDC